MQIVPEGAAREALATDYAKMLEDEVMVGNALPFDELMRSCAEVAAHANAAAQHRTVRSPLDFCAVLRKPKSLEGLNQLVFPFGEFKNPR
ncbi:hypothetical protein [Variovorax sp. Root411]|uniref:hypothetical protein n=1 Tax=Variovorax sp. Root411 TaxID=1736530 RepID=UPI00138F5C8D|nr:hypothetical protein [Variovorax sp. Root411]